jgi:hypothetical protein
MKTAAVNLEELADKCMTNVIAMSTVFNNEIHEGVRLGINIDTRKVRGLTYAVIVPFGSYVIQQRELGNIGFEKKEEFANLMREKFLSIQKVVTTGNNDEKLLANMYDGPMQKITSMKGPVTKYLKDSLAVIFAKYTDLEFAENTFFNRFKPSSKLRVSMKILDDLVLAVWKGFMGLDIDSA